nr:hypothetical protein Iba_chr05fCG11600 [Ipomoea batatas]
MLDIEIDKMKSEFKSMDRMRSLMNFRLVVKKLMIECWKSIASCKKIIRNDLRSWSYG